MTQTEETADRDLVLARMIDAPPAKVFRAWTDPALLVQWFAPLPWTTPKAELDVRPGGSNMVVMRGPDGTEFPNRGVYLEVVENQRLVFTDAFVAAWEPSSKPFMTVILTFEDVGGEDVGGKTRYTALVRHWSWPTGSARENGVPRRVGTLCRSARGPGRADLAACGEIPGGISVRRARAG
jgi:uncharacterized protein YndB with AHSA1/START domain